MQVLLPFHEYVGAVKDDGTQNGGGTGSTNGTYDNSWAVLDVVIAKTERDYVANTIKLTVNWHLTGYGCYVIGWVNTSSHRSNNETARYWAGYNQQGTCDKSGTMTITKNALQRGTISGSIPCHVYHQVYTKYEGTYYSFSVPWSVEDEGLEYFLNNNYNANFTEYIRQRNTNENWAILQKLLYYYKIYTNNESDTDIETMENFPIVYSLINNSFSNEYKDMLNYIQSAALNANNDLIVPDDNSTIGVTAEEYNAAKAIVNNIGQLNKYDIVPKLESYYIVLRTLGYNV